MNVRSQNTLQSSLNDEKSLLISSVRKIGRADNPACHFPENEFCCFCRDRVCPQTDFPFGAVLGLKFYRIITAIRCLRMLPLTLEERSPLPR